MNNIQSDYTIIGGGLSGLLLALTLSEKDFFKDKEIIIVEPSEKKKNDKTWCYWEKGKGEWDHLNSFQWKKGELVSQKAKINLEMNGYVYKMIRSIDFYNHAKNKLSTFPNIKWVSESCNQLHKKDDSFLLETDQHQIEASFVFDSRVEKEALVDKKYPSLSQHFKGWIIESEEDIFEEGIFRMMDFRQEYKDACCFTYVLPFSKNRALIEFTFFNNEIVEEEVYDDLLKKYIENYLDCKEYKIEETEKGIIPMSSYPFHKTNSENYLKIGTAGGWVKASSGYSFKRTTQKTTQICNNIVEGKKLDHKLLNSRFMIYDRLFLSVLMHHNQIGNSIFEKMYSSNSADLTFDFLDEKTNFFQELKIMSTFNKPLFLRAIWKEYF